MSDALSADRIRAGLVAMAEALAAQADALNALDAAIGDGDMGVTMRLGTQAVLAELPKLTDADLSTLLMRAGMAFNRAASSTIGALIATAGMSAGKEVKGMAELDLPALARATNAAAAAIGARGKALRGDKTLLDALIPAGEVLTQAAEEGVSLHEAGQRALAAAEAGVEETTALRSKVGRAGWVGDRTVGQPDAGATAVVIALRALVEPRSDAASGS
jgi:dihydroxyacetone kinase